MKRTPIILLLVIVSIMTIAVLFWVTGNETTENQTKSAMVRLKVGYIPIVDCSQLYVASQRGYFTAAGLDVELVALAGGPPIIQALSTGAIDIGFANLATIVFYEQTAPRLIRLSGGTRMDKDHSEAGLVVLADSGIEQISDIKGKIVAVNSRRNIVDLAILRAIRLSGLTAKDITFVELPFKDMETALRSKRVDVTPLPEPFLSVALRNGGLRNLGDHFALAFGELFSTGYFSMANSATVTPDVIRKFNAAISNATRDLKSPDDNTFGAISAVTKIPKDVLMLAGRPDFVSEIPESAFIKMQSWLEDESLLKKKSD